MSKGNNHFTSTRLLLAFGLMMIVTVRLVRPSESSEYELDDNSDNSSEEDGAVDPLLKSIRDRLEALHPSPLDSPLELKKREEAAPTAAIGRSSAAASLYRRSALNKNFIRFGRSGFKPRQMHPTEPVNISQRMMPESDPDSAEERLPPRASRSLSSNFIRFGRSFFPSNRWIETTRRFNRAGRRMSLVDSDSSRSSRSSRSSDNSASTL